MEFKDIRDDFTSDVYNTLDFLPTNNEANRIIDSFDRIVDDAIIIPKGATNGDMVEIIFGKDVYCTLIRMMYSSCCEKLKKWWNAPYKRGNSDGSN